MNQKLRIAVADDEADMRQYFARILPRMGHEVVAVAANGRELLEACMELRPDMVISDIKMPEMDGIQAAEAIYEHLPIPVILVSGFIDADLIERAEDDHILAYLVKPIKQADLLPAIAIAWKRFRQFQSIQDEADDLRQALEDRKLVEKAKALLMRTQGFEESAAFDQLQAEASQFNQRLVDSARSILEQA